MRLLALLLCAACSQKEVEPTGEFDYDLGFSAHLIDGGNPVHHPAVAYQIDPAHSGNQLDPSLVLPLERAWSMDLGGAVSYALISDGRIFVTTDQLLIALDAPTGNRLWSAPVAAGTAALDGDSLFVAFADGVSAWDAPTGRVLWKKSLTGSASSPVAAQGIVLTVGNSQVFALRQSDGALLWSVPAGAGAAVPILAEDVFGAFDCNDAWRLQPQTGAQIWHHAATCAQGGSGAPALFGGRLWARDSRGGGAALDQTGGAQVSTFTADTIPAFDGNTGFFLANGRLQAIALDSAHVRWSASGSGLAIAPIVVNHVVYLGSASGLLRGFDADGNLVWSTDVGAPISASADGAGLTAGEGMLLVPAGRTLVGYVSMPSAGGDL